MKLIIAGGRNYRLTQHDRARLDALHAAHHVTEVVSGGATGADRGGEMWANDRGLPFTVIPAEWDNLEHPDAAIRTRADGKKYDAMAGFRRNERMAQYADAVVLFPGGNGTRDMATRAAHHRLQIFDWRKP